MTRTGRPTIVDIAELAGVSTGAVSYALNGRPGVSDDTRARILEIARDIGWRPNIAARALSVSRAHAVGMIITRSAATLGLEPFFMRFLAGVEAELSAHHHALLLQVAEDHAAAIEATRLWWAERRIDGVIVTDLWHSDSRLAVLEQLQVPAVLVGRPQPGTALPSVWSDDASAVTQVVDYLVALGHERIARVSGLPDLDHTQVRSAAFAAAMQRHGLPDPEIMVTDYSWEQGARATRTLLTRKVRPTAITFDNDIMAVSALGVAREMGICVPEQLSLVAGDDSQLCAMVHPPLTALSRDIPAYGVRAARTLLDLIETGAAASFQDATAHLVPRGSTAAPDHR